MSPQGYLAGFDHEVINQIVLLCQNRQNTFSLSEQKSHYVYGI